MLGRAAHPPDCARIVMARLPTVNRAGVAVMCGGSPKGRWARRSEEADRRDRRPEVGGSQVWDAVVSEDESEGSRETV